MIESAVNKESLIVSQIAAASSGQEEDFKIWFNWEEIKKKEKEISDKVGNIEKIHQEKTDRFFEYFGGIREEGSRTNKS